MGKTNFQYDETGNTYYYVFLTFLGLVLLPSTYYFWPSEEEVDPEKKKKYVSVCAKDTVYAQACAEKAVRMAQAAGNWQLADKLQLQLGAFQRQALSDTPRQ